MIYLVGARERTLYWRNNAPTSAQIDNAWRRAASGLRGLGRFVGVGPRIVRHLVDRESTSDDRRWGLWTYAVQPFALDEARVSLQSPATRLLRTVLEWIDHELRGIPGTEWDDAVVNPYSATRNGSPTWWGGAAQRTETRDAQSDFFGNLSQTNAEDPLGPGPSSAPATPRDQITQAARDAAERAARAARGLVGDLTPWLLLGGLILGVALLPRVAQTRRAARELAAPNPRKRARNGTPVYWRTMEPGSPYPCKAKLLGQLVPGKGGGLVDRCATPRKEKPREGQVWLVPAGQPALPGIGHAMPKPRAARRVRAAKRGDTKRADDSDLIAQTIQAFRATGLPQPVGVEFPHVVGGSPCDPEHKTWTGYTEALEDVSERAAIEVEDPEDFLGYEQARARELLQHPMGPTWRRTTETCATQYDQRQARKKSASVDDLRDLARKLKDAGRLGAGLDERDIIGDYLSEIRSEARRGKKKRGAYR